MINNGVHMEQAHFYHGTRPCNAAASALPQKNVLDNVHYYMFYSGSRMPGLWDHQQDFFFVYNPFLSQYNTYIFFTKPVPALLIIQKLLKFHIM
jgi:hypothetical protein